MWFLVNSKASIFGQDEFELISGLSFGLFPQHNETWLRIRDAYFNGENKVRNDHLEKVFISFGEVKNQKKKKREGETPSDFNPLQSIFEEAMKAFHKWLTL